MTDQSSTCTPSSSAELAVAEPKRKKSRKVMTLDEKRKIVQRFRDDPKIKVATVAREYGKTKFPMPLSQSVFIQPKAFKSLKV